MAHDLAQEAWLRNEVGVEDRDQVALGPRQAVVERARLVAVAVGAPDVDRVDATSAELLDLGRRDLPRFVARVVEHLDLQAIQRVVRAASSIQQPGDDGRLVVQRELDGDVRQLVIGHDDAVLGRLEPLAMPRAQPDQVRAVDSVTAENQENGEIEQNEGGFHAVSIGK